MNEKIRRLIGLAGLSIAFLGCADGSATGPDETRVAAVEGSTASIVAADLVGSWEWRNRERLRIPPFLTPILGILPEGRNTHAFCESVGTLTITPASGGFEGIAVRTFNLCRTDGGQSFQQPGSTLFVRDGRVHGNSVEFSFESPTVKPCPHHAVATRAAGAVVKLSGTGHCRLPGHPQSESPVDLPPPPGGTSATLLWEAERS